jgi:hypothetical protein
MIGCMSETSCATAAAHLAMADWVEFRWNLGVTNDPFQTPRNMTIHLNDTITESAL